MFWIELQELDINHCNDSKSFQYELASNFTYRYNAKHSWNKQNFPSLITNVGIKVDFNSHLNAPTHGTGRCNWQLKL